MMAKMMKIVDGNKVYLGALALILVGVSELMGVDLVDSVNPDNAVDIIYSGFMVMAGRSALKKLEK